MVTQHARFIDIAKLLLVWFQNRRQIPGDDLIEALPRSNHYRLEISEGGRWAFFRCHDVTDKQLTETTTSSLQQRLSDIPEVARQLSDYFYPRRDYSDIDKSRMVSALQYYLDTLIGTNRRLLIEWVSDVVGYRLGIHVLSAAEDIHRVIIRDWFEYVYPIDDPMAVADASMAVAAGEVPDDLFGQLYNRVNHHPMPVTFGCASDLSNLVHDRRLLQQQSTQLQGYRPIIGLALYNPEQNMTVPALATRSYVGWTVVVRHPNAAEVFTVSRPESAAGSGPVTSLGTARESEWHTLLTLHEEQPA